MLLFIHLFSVLGDTDTNKRDRSRTSDDGEPGMFTKEVTALFEWMRHQQFESRNYERSEDVSIFSIYSCQFLNAVNKMITQVYLELADLVLGFWVDMNCAPF